MDRGHAERVFAAGERRGRAAARRAHARSASATSTLRGVNLIISVNQNVPSCVAAGTNNGCRPNPTYAQQQPVLVRRPSPTITACTCRSCSGRHGGATTASATRCRRRWTTSASSSSARRSIRSTSSKDWGRSDDDQRHRLVLNGAVNSSMAPAATVWEQLSHGFQVSGMLQYYSALPFNITSGVTTVQGTAGRPIVNGAFIDAQRRRSAPTSSASSMRVSRTFRIGDRRAARRPARRRST